MLKDIAFSEVTTFSREQLSIEDVLVFLFLLILG